MSALPQEVFAQVTQAWAIQDYAFGEKLLAEATRKALNGNRAKGLMSREWFFRADRPDALEAIGVDVWFDADGMQAVYADPEEMAPLANLFTARPTTSVWARPAGQWVEW